MSSIKYNDRVAVDWCEPLPPYKPRLYWGFVDGFGRHEKTQERYILVELDREPEQRFPRRVKASYRQVRHLSLLEKIAEAANG